MVEFLLIAIPMLFLMSATLGVCWVAYVKTQARVVAGKAAFQLSQPDSEISEVIANATNELQSKLGPSPMRVEGRLSGNFAEIRLTTPARILPGFSELHLPELEVISHEVQELGG